VSTAAWTAASALTEEQDGNPSRVRGSGGSVAGDSAVSVSLRV
jgi:hypothetical protein